jgi:hypothetical protein
MALVLSKAAFCHTFTMHPQDLRVKKISLTLAAQLITRIDVLAVRDYTSRTALLEYLRKPVNLAKSESAVGEDVVLNQLLAEFAREQADND